MNIITSNCFIRELGTCTKESAIKQMLEILQKRNPLLQQLDFNNLLDEVIARETAHTTGIGNGIAFPHLRIDLDFDDLFIAFAYSSEGIEFNSMDQKAVNAIFLMLSSQNKPYLILQQMSQIIRLLKKDIDNKTLSLERIKTLLSTTSQIDQGNKIFCRDIMHPAKIQVQLNTPIEEVARLMHVNNLQVLPVINQEHVLCGQISCHDIFYLGMPGFFEQLQTVSFVKYMDPFEKYFQIKKNLQVKDVYKTETCKMNEKNTLIEITYELVIKHKQVIFVTNDQNKLIGQINSLSLVDKILFF